MSEVNHKRSYFLTNRWSPYPPFDKLAVEWGRVLGFSSDHELIIKSLRPEDFFETRTKTFSDLKAQSFWQEILVPGDLISIDDSLEIKLLVPNLSREINPDSELNNRWPILDSWSYYLSLVRKFFSERDFIEVCTPLIVNHPGSEPSLDPFKIKLKNGRQEVDKYLPTSPELSLKKILTCGVPKIFEITKSFRNNESSKKHTAEFWILEWYRNFDDLEAIKLDIMQLISFLQKELKNYFLQKKYTELLAQLNENAAFEAKSFSQVFLQSYQFNFQPTTDLNQLKKFCKDHHINYVGEANIEDLFSVITLEKIESQLDPQKISFLEKYPPYAAALARKDQQGWAERFEVYWQGLEIANAFFELNDPEEQAQRFIQDNLQKIKNQLAPLPLDDEFLSKLKWGLPPCSGIALGLERLFMALLKIKNINDISRLA